MAGGISETRHEESCKRIKNDFSGIRDETLRNLYAQFRNELEREAVIFDFIPILTEKIVRNYLRNNAELPRS